MPLHSQPQDHISSSTPCHSEARREGWPPSQSLGLSQGKGQVTGWEQDGLKRAHFLWVQPSQPQGRPAAGPLLMWAPLQLRSRRGRSWQTFVDLRLPQESAIKPMEALKKDGWAHKQAAGKCKQHQCGIFLETLSTFGAWVCGTVVYSP